MALSNRFGHLVLSTGNKSEIAVGYCTLYGDMAGGYALLSDVPKTLVYELARELNRGAERIPPASISKEPSAELRPNQKDSDTLPPYSVLDPLIETLVDLSLPFRAAARRAGVSAALARDTARRIDRAEYKRRQMPPGPKVTARAFGEGRRYPIAQKFQV
jgi:NAD+ synthase (glutamine-hydrolysing)